MNDWIRKCRTDRNISVITGRIDKRNCRSQHHWFMVMVSMQESKKSRESFMVGHKVLEAVPNEDMSGVKG